MENFDDFGLSLDSPDPIKPPQEPEQTVVVRGLSTEDWERVIALMVDAKDAAEATKNKVSVIYRYNEDTDEYEGASGRFYKALTAELRANQDKFDHVWQYAKGLNPTELYKWLSGQLTTFLNGVTSAKLAEIDERYKREIDELRRLSDAALKENSRLLGEYSRKYASLSDGFGKLTDKVDSALVNQNADIQEVKRTVQAAMYDMGALFAQSLKEAAHYKELSQKLVAIVILAVVGLGVVGGLLMAKYSSDADLARQEAEIQGRVVKSQIYQIDSLETVIRGRQYTRK